MLRIKLLKSNAREIAIAHLDRMRELKALGQENVQTGESNWEVLAQLVELLQSSAYADLKEVQFYRDDFRADGTGGLTHISVERMSSFIKNDIEVRPQ